MLLKIYAVAGFLAFVTCLYPDTTEENRNYSIPLTAMMDSLQTDPGNLEVLIDKSDYKLTLLDGEKILKEYPVVFGGNPVDDKLMQGDQCTPEGSFKMVSKYPHRNWSKFIWINYPTPNSWEKHNRAKSDMKIPESADIGGEIGIHGTPEGMDDLIDQQYNWTLGCISLKNKDVNEIYPYITSKTLITIRK